MSRICDAFLAPFGLTITRYGLRSHIQSLPGCGSANGSSPPPTGAIDAMLARLGN